MGSTSPETKESTMGGATQWDQKILTLLDCQALTLWAKKA
jgi:hypothetical protein